MKNIEVPSVIICSMGDPDEVLKTKEVDHTYRENVKTIILAAAHVENRLASGVGKYFFGDNPSKRLEFDNLILSSDAFSFSSKRKAFLFIVKKQKILEGAQYNAIEKLISKIIRFRNMFTHGTPVYSGSKCMLHYFEGTKKEKEITDDFLSEVQEHLTECLIATENLVQKIRVIDTQPGIGEI